MASCGWPSSNAVSAVLNRSFSATSRFGSSPAFSVRGELPVE